MFDPIGSLHRSLGDVPGNHHLALTQHHVGPDPLQPCVPHRVRSHHGPLPSLL